MGDESDEVVLSIWEMMPNRCICMKCVRAENEMDKGRGGEGSSKEMQRLCGVCALRAAAPIYALWYTVTK